MAKILLVEDDGLMSRMYGRLFAYEGYDVEVAADGEAGFVKAKEFQPDLILLDVMMPRMNGLELIQKLKEESRTRDITLVLLTNLGIQEKIDEAMRLGAAGCIIKSNHSPEEVIKLVEGFLTKNATNAS
jgi:CheY-like chemotaxis protein